MNSVSPSPLFAAYQSPGWVYDELLNADGSVRSHWSPFIDHIQRLGPKRTDRLWEKSRSALEVSQRHSNHAHSNHDGPSTELNRFVADRPWDVDAIPWVIDRDDWQTLTDGLIQRAQVLDATLADLYGEQRLLSEGIVPPELLYEHPAFNRGVATLNRSRRRFLNLYAVDVARSVDGQWWVLADRTDAALGLGYALENRLILSRTFPGVFHEMNVERYSGFCDALQRELGQIARRIEPSGRIVILTEGPQHSGYFEDFYLANFLGVTLTQGSDLIVRDNRLWLKTIGGLEPVSVVFRRMSDAFCDPLEQTSESATLGNNPVGCAALTSVCRAGNVEIINPLGSSLVESAAFMSFLGPISKRLFGEDLKINSLATWWCGQPSELSRVQQDDQLQTNSAFRNGRRRSVNSIFRFEADYQQRLLESPQSYVGQETIFRSSLPTRVSGKLRSYQATLRLFLLGTDNGFQVLPGGLARVDNQENAFQSDVLAGQFCKDVWVIGDQRPVAHESLSQLQLTPQYQLPTGDIPSRVADNFLWLGRTIERVDSSARLVRTSIRRSAGEANFELERDWPGLVRQLANRGLIEPDYAVAAFQPSLEPLKNRLVRVIVQRGYHSSLPANVDQIIRLAGSLRDRLSLDAWECLLQLHSRVDNAVAVDDVTPYDLLTLTSQIIRELAGFVGLISESMTRSLAWRFLDLGRRIERCLVSSSIALQIASGSKKDVAQWQALVEAADSSMTYRFRYLGNWEIQSVLNLLFADESNPRSVAHQLVSIQEHLSVIEGLPGFDDANGGSEVTNTQAGKDYVEAASKVADSLSKIRKLFPAQPKKFDIQSIEKLRQQVADDSQAILAEIPQVFDRLQARYVSHTQLQRFN